MANTFCLPDYLSNDKNSSKKIPISADIEIQTCVKSWNFLIYHYHLVFEQFLQMPKKLLILRKHFLPSTKQIDFNSR